MTSSIHLPDVEATEDLGLRLAHIVQGQGGVILLEGDLGAGKTTLVRALLYGLGHSGPVVSPSYTLLEPYNAGPRQVWHMDLYRLSDPRELEYLGVRDLDPEKDLLLIEWPEHGRGGLPAADLTLSLDCLPAGRRLHAQAHSSKGQGWLGDLFADSESVG